MGFLTTAFNEASWSSWRVAPHFYDIWKPKQPRKALGGCRFQEMPRLVDFPMGRVFVVVRMQKGGLVGWLVGWWRGWCDTKSGGFYFWFVSTDGRERWPSVDERNPEQPPGMYKTLYINNGISTTNLNWWTPDFWTINSTSPCLSDEYLPYTQTGGWNFSTHQFFSSPN